MHIPPIHGVIAIAMGKNAFEKGERKTIAALIMCGQELDYKFGLLGFYTRDVL